MEAGDGAAAEEERGGGQHGGGKGEGKAAPEARTAQLLAPDGADGEEGRGGRREGGGGYGGAAGTHGGAAAVGRRLAPRPPGGAGRHFGAGPAAILWRGRGGWRVAGPPRLRKINRLAAEL